jgi:hypothetical protein
VSDDKDDAVRNQFPGCGDCLLGIAEVVGRDELNLLAEYAARGIDVGNRQLRTALKLLAGPCELSRHRARDPY